MTVVQKMPGTRSSFMATVRRTAALNATATAISTLAGILLARWLGPDGRGDYAAAATYMTLALLVFELGLSSSVVYHVSQRRTRQADVVRTASAVLVPLAAVAAAVSAILAHTVFGGPGERHAAFLILPVSIVVALAASPATFALQALSLRRWNLVRLVYPVTYISLLLVANARNELGASDALVLMTVALAAQTACAWLLYLKAFGARGRVDTALIRPMLGFGVLNMASTAPNSINARLDQLVLALVVSSAALGQYAVAVSLSALAAPLVVAFGNVAFPRIARGEALQATVRAATRGSLVLSGGVLAVVVATAPWLVPVVFGPGYEQAPHLLLLLAPGALVLSTNQVLGDLLRGLGHPARIAKREWAGVAVTALGLLALIPRFGVAGAAITSSVTYWVVFILLRRAVSRTVQAAVETANGSAEATREPER